jgi:hypothetical protein
MWRNFAVWEKSSQLFLILSLEARFFISPLERNVTPRGVVDESPEVPRGELSLQGMKLSPRRGDLLLALLFF